MVSDLEKKSKSLKSAIERYNLYKKFVDTYNHNRSLDGYIEYIKSTMSGMSDDLKNYYESMILSYGNGNHEPMLQNLYDRLLCADDNKDKAANDLKNILREQ